MTVISSKVAHDRQDCEEVSESACAEKADLGKSLVRYPKDVGYFPKGVR
jgi:hypothetical protein